MPAMYNKPGDYEYKDPSGANQWSGWEQKGTGAIYYTNPFRDSRATSFGFRWDGQDFTDLESFANYIKEGNKYSDLPFFIQEEGSGDPASGHSDYDTDARKSPYNAYEEGKSGRGGNYYRGNDRGSDTSRSGAEKGGPPPNIESWPLAGGKLDFPEYDYKLLNIDDYKTETPESLQKYATEGLGKDWLSSAFHSQADSIAQGAINERKQIDDVVSRSGFQNTGFAGQAKELSRANQASGEIGTWLDVEDKNKSFMQNAQQQVLDIDNYNKNLRSQIDQFNAGQDLNKYQYDQYKNQAVNQIRILNKAAKDKSYADMFGGFATLLGTILGGPSGGAIASMLAGGLDADKGGNKDYTK